MLNLSDIAVNSGNKRNDKLVDTMSNINPFRPGSGIFPPYFAGREREINIFKDKLEQTISGTPMHMSIIGDWASGKTSLLIKFREIAEKEGLFCPISLAPQTSSSAVFVGTLINNILNEVKKRHTSTYNKILDGLKNIRSVQAFGFGVSSKELEKTVQTPQYDLKITLNDVWSSIKDKYKGILILIDDIDTVKNEKEIMLTFRNALMEAIMDKTKVMCVVSGTEKLFEGFEKAHAPLIRFFEPFILGNLNDKESEEAILIPLKNSNVTFNKQVTEKIIKTTRGQPYYLQEFCYHLFNNAVDGKVTMNVYNASYSNIMHDIATKIWNQRIQQLGDINTKILFLIATENNEASRIVREAEKQFNIPVGTVRSALSRMQRENKIDKTRRGVYTIKDNLFGEYIRGLF